ncbi:flagellin B [Sulfurospirillum sp. T05]|uniref:Flagellin n=1 Tax=Sulfurospirillum tamanense TaxID=2813362 RepID=A0ABS2WS59_9BACT|nr:flagellin B [Sulfurospirillum tamanensis]MBN2964457.1 flagellin B [Sulfurospirillum tamanensis]
MSFRINTNVSAMNAHTSSVANNRNLSGSLAKLSSGLRINTAADDASGMAIADSLRSQASALGQAINNANDAISMAQTADKAMDEQLKILDTIKVKATQAAQDGQNANSRKALQADIKRLTEQLDNIAGQTTFNGKSLLSGSFTNAQFQVGAYSGQTVSMSIGATSSDKIGQTRFETSDMGGTLTSSAVVTFTDVRGNTTDFEGVVISTSAGTGIGALAEVINKNSDLTGVTASWSLTQTSSAAVTSGSVSTLTINGIIVAESLDVEANDRSGVLVDAINQYKETTGVTASVDARGNLELTSTDGRAIEASGFGGVEGGDIEGTFTGRLTLMSAGAADIQMTIAGAADLDTSGANEKSVSLRDMMSEIDNDTAEAMGAFANDNVMGATDELGAGVTTFTGAQAMMKVAQSAQEKLDSIRADIGSAQNQLVATVNNISVTQVNVKAAESQIRDVDFAAESASFSKFNILAQSGSYAMSQANAVQQNVLRLLQ